MISDEIDIKFDYENSQFLKEICYKYSVKDKEYEEAKRNFCNIKRY